MSVSADNYGIVTCALWFVSLFETVDKLKSGPLSKREYAHLVIASILVVFSKMPNFVFLGLIIPVCIIVYRNTQKSKQIIFALLVALFAEAVFTVLWFLYIGDVNTGAFWGRNVDTKAQIQFILSDIPGFLRMLVEFLISYDFSQIQLGYTYSHFFSIPIVLTVSYYIGVYLAARIGVDEKSESAPKEIAGEKWLKNFGILLLVCYIILVSVILYLQFSEVGSRMIEGVQPRYFLPAYLFLAVTIPYHYSKRCYSVPIILGMALLPMIYYGVVSVSALMI